MPVSTFNLTTFEEQVLQTMIDFVISRGGSVPCTDGEIANRGNTFGGSYWTGKKYGASYPKINAALGRLRRKGLVYRRDFPNESWGTWFLTSQALEVFGLSHFTPASN